MYICDKDSLICCSRNIESLLARLIRLSIGHQEQSCLLVENLSQTNDVLELLTPPGSQDGGLSGSGKFSIAAQVVLIHKKQTFQCSDCVLCYGLQRHSLLSLSVDGPLDLSLAKLQRYGDHLFDTFDKA